MKIWLEFSYSWLYNDEEHVKCAITWFKHSERYPYKGFTFSIHFFKWMLLLHWVNNYGKYNEVMNKRYSFSKY